MYDRLVTKRQRDKQRTGVTQDKLYRLSRSR